jgi:hypothetical protein
VTLERQTLKKLDGIQAAVSQEHRRSTHMLKKLTTVLGLALMSSSLAFAAQAPATDSNQAAPKPATAQGTPSLSQQHPSTASKSVKKHKRHHKKNTTASNATTSNPTTKSSTPKQ